MKERTISDVLKRYEDAESVFPAWTRLELFSWQDMIILKKEIETLNKVIASHISKGSALE